MLLQIFALLGRYVRSLESGNLIHTVAEACNHMYLVVVA
jgi:hypothetical protein